ncbi:helix-turn-helix transcriptional regulator [Viridibacillus sp. FSL H8-0123]|uniref:helix-turn-helix domain-containing protein n=1 Tax=Viridibacillus sp. FSL H8-0123 TaxID=1928922 RepID=UPI00096DC9CF|nr:helix-turn-helix transcriptional regulator [Viridibacillus sp. FSL H8-0123]OMC80923.1 hypothetical protein BK130_16505 [Viridibacillus sp. FSL H8-0123]
MVNNLVRDMRNAQGLTVRDFAKKIGVTPATITSAESKSQLTQKMKASVLRVFELDDTFFDYVEQKRRLEKYEAQ